MSNNAPVCHISTNQGVVDQPRPTLLPTIPAAIDLPSALAAINALKLMIQQLSGQQGAVGAGGINGFAGLRGAAGIAGAAGSQGQKGNTGTNGKTARYAEDRGQRVVNTIRVFQDNDLSSDNYVDIARVDRVVWVDQVTGQNIVWSR